MTTSMNTDLSGKRAIVTGASRGIGEAIARRLASAGARVALASRKLEGLETVGKSIETETMIVQANMSRSEDVAAIVPAVVEAWGGVDILINNAGTNPVFGPILETEERAWDKTFDINVKGPFLLSQAAAAEMDKAGGGAIVNIASTGGLEPSPMLGAYSVSKAAIIMLTKVLAAELGSSSIRVNCIAPGLVDTKFASVLVNTPSIHDAYVKRAALGRHGEPDEIAGAALYLASGESSFMTGQVMVIDGGMRF
ncbi:MAG: SDR family oxidoreductase [Deltaproteobacteria bacterium]